MDFNIKVIQCWSKNSSLVALNDDFCEHIEMKDDYDYARTLIALNQEEFINIEHDIIFTESALETLKNFKIKEDFGGVVGNYQIKGAPTAHRTRGLALYYPLPQYPTSAQTPRFIEVNKFITSEMDEAEMVGFGFIKFRKGIFEELGFKNENYLWNNFDTVFSERAVEKNIKFQVIPNLWVKHLHV